MSNIICYKLTFVIIICNKIKYSWWDRYVWDTFPDLDLNERYDRRNYQIIQNLLSTHRVFANQHFSAN